MNRDDGVLNEAEGVWNRDDRVRNRDDGVRNRDEGVLNKDDGVLELSMLEKRRLLRLKVGDFAQRGSSILYIIELTISLHLDPFLNKVPKILSG